MIRHLLTGLLAAATLTACSGKTSTTDKDAQAEAAMAKVEASPDTRVAKGLPVVAAKPGKAPAAAALPPAFEGHWGMRPADCDISRADTKGLLIVKGNTLTFYEATATATVVGGPSRYKVVADLAYKGEGREWRTRETLELTAAGTVLQRTGQSPVKTYRYERC
ncbi:hypothetical protein [Sphingomonas sp. Leaf357]|uniref:hypothetical protein n=1 Tax=Sphingomonas sp. Leaf357 TaxID=1736350 RepID=UPI000A592D43|nr:hypothetical protein [Sphingomonas sp. Leaf357]